MLSFSGVATYRLLGVCALALILSGCSNTRGVVVRLNDDGFVLVYVPLCDEFHATMAFPYAFNKSGYREELECTSGARYSIDVRRTVWTGVYESAEYEAIVNGQRFHLTQSDPGPEVKGGKVALLLSEDNQPLPYAFLACNAEMTEQIRFSYNDQGRSQVSTYEMGCGERRYVVEYDNYTYDDMGVMLTGFSAHMTSHRQ